MHLHQCTPQGHITGHSQASSFIQARDWHQKVKKCPWKWSLLQFKSCFLLHRNKKCTFTFYKLISVRTLYAFITSLQAWPHENDLIQDSFSNNVCSMWMGIVLLCSLWQSFSQFVQVAIFSLLSRQIQCQSLFIACSGNWPRVKFSRLQDLFTLACIWHFVALGSRVWSTAYCIVHV